VTRVEALKSLSRFDRPLNLLSQSLFAFECDYENEPVIVQAADISEVLRKFLVGKISAEEIEEWANLIESREDLEFEEKKQEQIASIIYQLANPVLEGKITLYACKNFIAILDI
jgi:hypothetical protein